MKAMGHNGYRMSIAWPRIYPGENCSHNLEMTTHATLWGSGVNALAQLFSRPVSHPGRSLP
jgi:beta-glucosidase/6-phospho-beta-glucosidase/beta-galactosidase